MEETHGQEKHGENGIIARSAVEEQDREIGATCHGEVGVAE
jgi:hypothetical protein